MLVLSSSKADFVNTGKGYVDYLFYTDYKLDPRKFKLLHSLQFSHDADSNYGMFTAYLLIGDSGEEYFLGTFFQEEKSKKITFSRAQQVHTIDNGSHSGSIFTVRIYHTNFVARSVAYPSYSFNSGGTNNYIPATPQLIGSSYNGVAINTINHTFDSGGLPYLTFGLDGYIDYTPIAAEIGDLAEDDRWSQVLKFRTYKTGIPLMAMYATNGRYAEIYLDHSGYVMMDGIRTIQTSPSNDGQWHLLTFNALPDTSFTIVDIDDNVGDSELDLTPFVPQASYIGASATPSPVHKAWRSGSGMVRYIHNDGLDSGPLHLDGKLTVLGSITGLPTVVFHENRRALQFTETQAIDLEDHVAWFAKPEITICFWINPVFLTENRTRVFYIGTGDLVTTAYPEPDADYFLVGYQHDTGELRLFSRNWVYEQDNYLEIRAALAPNIWSHVTITIQSGDYKVYINGTEPTYTQYDVFNPALSFADFPTADSCYIGCVKFNGDIYTPMNGYLGEFTVFDRILSALEINEMVNTYPGVVVSDYAGGDVGITDIHSMTKNMFDPQRTEIQNAVLPAYSSNKPKSWQLRLKVEQI